MGTSRLERESNTPMRAHWQADLIAPYVTASLVVFSHVHIQKDMGERPAGDVLVRFIFS